MRLKSNHPVFKKKKKDEQDDPITMNQKSRVASRNNQVIDGRPCHGQLLTRQNPTPNSGQNKGERAKKASIPRFPVSSLRGPLT